MPRKNLVRSKTHAYHVTARTNNSEEFPVHPLVVWAVFSFHLYELQVLYRVHIHAFVLMPNHFHLLISTPEADLGESMKHFMGSVTKSVNRKSGRTGRVFGARYHWTLVDSARYLTQVTKYIFRNPVRAGLCTSTLDYPYSSLPRMLGASVLEFPVHYPAGMLETGFNYTDQEFLLWLDIPMRAEQEKIIQHALRKPRFEVQKSPNWKRTRGELTLTESPEESLTQ